MLVRPAGFPSVDAMFVHVPSANVEAVAVNAMIIVVSERVRSMRQTFQGMLGGVPINAIQFNAEIGVSSPHTLMSGSTGVNIPR